MVQRSDTTAIKRFKRTPQGGLKIDSYPTRVGILIYKNEDGTPRRELRPAESVFSSDSLESLKNATVTDLHPKEPVTTENYKALSVGHISEDVKPSGDFVAASTIVNDGNTIKAIENGDRREMSCGYECTLDDTPGVWRGQKYDAVQTNIRYNHVALGPTGWGRAGSSVALRLDEKDDNDMADKVLIRIDGKDFEKGSDEHIARLEVNHSTSLKVATDRADAADKSLATEKARADKAEADLKVATDPKVLSERIKTRADLLTNAREVLGERFDEAASETMGDVEMMGEMLKILNPSFKTDGVSDDFIRGAYAVALVQDAASEDPDEDEDKTSESGEGEWEGGPAEKSRKMMKKASKKDSIYSARQGREPKEDGQINRYDSNAARERAKADSSEAWKQPLHMSRDAR